jgi:cell division cycle 20-like protein 1 (cofactor of APC complex)
MIRGGYMDFCNDYIKKDDEVSQTIRVFPKTPYKVLNAPRLKDDFYTSVLDWNKDDQISVVLDNAAYVWSSKGNDAEKLVEGYISSIKWGKGLIIGEETGRIRLIDVEKRQETARSKNHLGRIGVLDVSMNGN